MRAWHRARRQGFTLLEVLVALALGGMVMLGSRLMIEQVAATASVVGASQRAADDLEAGSEQLRALVFQVDSDSLRGSPFSGSAHRADFVSWCDVPGGWQERCTVAMRMEGTGRERRLRVRTSTGFSRAYPGLEDGELRYLVVGLHRFSWIEVWDESLVPPLAVGIVTPIDTMILRIGVRR